MKKLSIQHVKKLTKLEMRSITAGSNGGGGGGTGGGGTGGNNDCGAYCQTPFSGYCFFVCQSCNIPAGQTTGFCSA